MLVVVLFLLGASAGWCTSGILVDSETGDQTCYWTPLYTNSYGPHNGYVTVIKEQLSYPDEYGCAYFKVGFKVWADGSATDGNTAWMGYAHITGPGLDTSLDVPTGSAQNLKIPRMGSQVVYRSVEPVRSDMTLGITLYLGAGYNGYMAVPGDTHDNLHGSAPSGTIDDPIYTVGGGGGGLSADDKTWLQSFWDSQTTLSPEVSEAWADCIDGLKTCGPWGQIGDMANMHSDTPLRQMLPDGLLMPTRNVNGVSLGPWFASGMHMDSKMSQTCSMGDSAWSSAHPWFTTNPEDNTVSYWLGGFRKLIRGFLWVGFLVGVVVWIRGKITA